LLVFCTWDAERLERIIWRTGMSLALVAAFTGICFAGAVAAITIGINR
jgi:hypothetical protein